jgi:hypothetical protein
MDSVSDPAPVDLQPARCGGVAVLCAEEGRVLAVLVEKQHTVPDTYPLSLNALAAGCNQKTARDPVMELSEAEPGWPTACGASRPTSSAAPTPT